MREVGGEPFRIFFPVCEITALDRFAENKRILCSHILSSFPAKVCNSSVTNKLYTNNFITNNLVTNAHVGDSMVADQLGGCQWSVPVYQMVVVEFGMHLQLFLEPLVSEFLKYCRAILEEVYAYPEFVTFHGKAQSR